MPQAVGGANVAGVGEVGQVNRQDRRASDAQVRRIGAPSAALLQEQCKKLAAENHQMRTVLCAILKEQGRVRVSKKTVESLNEGDAIEERELPDAFMFEYTRSDMVVPGGVEDGKGKPKGAA
jgi:hypothetical protein